MSGDLTGKWKDLSSAPEDEAVLLATTGEWVREARLLGGDGEPHFWEWADGTKVHENLKPLAWQPLPDHPGETP